MIHCLHCCVGTLICFQNKNITFSKEEIMASSMPAFHECESNLDLGFVEDTPGWLLASRFFPSKVGGRPSWLDLKNVPSTEELSCDKCTRVLTFLLQIYAPIESDPNCFHRQVLVFMCLNVACHQFKVFRCQLPRHNEFFPSEAPVESQTWKPELNISKYTTVCRACGCPGSKKCSGCQKVSYCSREHQMADWKLRHKAECKNPGTKVHLFTARWRFISTIS